MYASTPMTRIATLDRDWRLAALRVLGVTFGALVLLIALAFAAMPRPTEAATFQTVSASAMELPQSTRGELLQPVGFFKKGGHLRKGHHFRNHGHFGNRGFFRKHHGFSGFRRHHGRSFYGQGKHRTRFHGRHRRFFPGHGKGFYIY